MKKLRVIAKGLKVDYLLSEVLSIPRDQWTKHSKKDESYRILPLTVPVVYEGNLKLLDSSETVNTQHYYNCRNVINWLRRNRFQHHTWAGVYLLPPGGTVPWHTDDRGEYYIGKMRYHLCLQGKYIYRMKEGDNIYEETIEPGTLFWFDLFTLHSAECISEDERITLLFDLPEPGQLINP
jgi:Aspartyl/Asparaginyl beta-hydroxylase